MTTKNTREDVLRNCEKTPNCWNYLGRISSHGYGVIVIGKKDFRAHRISYELFNGPIPEGLVVDHLCDNRRCVNPTHLEAKTNIENMMRSPKHPSRINGQKTHCKQGHEFSPENTKMVKGPNGLLRRSCIPCRRYYYARKKETQCKELQY